MNRRVLWQLLIGVPLVVILALLAALGWLPQFPRP
jgi:hypothetical protein